jgi:hypothetical protein
MNSANTKVAGRKQKVITIWNEWSALRQSIQRTCFVMRVVMQIRYCLGIDIEKPAEENSEQFIFTLASEPPYFEEKHDGAEEN